MRSQHEAKQPHSRDTDTGRFRLGATHCRLLCLCGLTLVILLSVAVGGAAAEATVTVDGPDEVDGSENVTVVLTDIPEGTDIEEYDIDLTYDSSAVNLEATVVEPFAGDVYQCPCDHLTIIADTNSPPTEDSVPLATVEIEPQTDGETTVAIDDVYALTDADGNDVAYDRSNLTVNGRTSDGDETGDSDDSDSSTSSESDGGGGGGAGDASPNLQSTWQSGLEETAVETGDTVEGQLELRNAGGTLTREPVVIKTDGETILEHEERLSAGAERTLEFDHVFTEPGEYEIVAESETLGTETLGTVEVTGEPIDESESTEDGGESGSTTVESSNTMTIGIGFIALLMIVIGAGSIAISRGNVADQISSVAQTVSVEMPTGQSGEKESGTESPPETSTSEPIAAPAAPSKKESDADSPPETGTSEPIIAPAAPTQKESDADSPPETGTSEPIAAPAAPTEETTPATEPPAETGATTGETASATTGEAGESHNISLFRDFTSKAGTDVKHLEATENGVNLAYSSAGTTKTEIIDEITTLASGYGYAVKYGLEAGALNVRVVDGTDPVAAWTVKTEWVERFDNGTLSEEAYERLVIETVRTL